MTLGGTLYSGYFSLYGDWYVDSAVVGECPGPLSCILSLDLEVDSLSDLFGRLACISAVALEVESGGGGGGGGGGGSASVSGSDSITFGESATVSGSGSSSSVSASDSITFAETASDPSRTGGGGGGDIATGRTDIACRACGAIVQIREDLILYADGLGAPVTWNGVSGTSTTLAGGVKNLAFPVAVRDRVWLFGDEPYMTGTVSTTAGVATITTSTTWPSSTLGKPVAIEGTDFDSPATCYTVVKQVNGNQVTLAKAPIATVASADFIVFGGTALATLQWSAENNHASYPDAVLPVGRLDGDLPTGAAGLAGSIVMFKRQHAYRFDYGFDPNEINDRSLTVLSETRGLVANKSCVVIEGTAYCMDQFGDGGYGEAGFWVTRGGALFPLAIGRPVAPFTAAGADYELDWGKSSCWFGWYSPASNSICWAATRNGKDFPDIAFEYFRPNVEGSDEPGRWSVREYDHYLMGAVTCVGGDGVLRPYLVVADKDNPIDLYLCADANTKGDMALTAQYGTVVSKTSSTVLKLNKHTKMQVGTIIEINGQKRTVTVDDTVNVTVSKAWTVEVAGKSWIAGFRPRVTFKTIAISTDPGYSIVHLDQIHALFDKQHSEASLTVSLVADGKSADWKPMDCGAATAAGKFRTDELLVNINPGIQGYNIEATFVLLSPEGEDFVYQIELSRHKYTEPPIGSASET